MTATNRLFSGRASTSLILIGSLLIVAGCRTSPIISCPTLPPTPPAPVLPTITAAEFDRIEVALPPPLRSVFNGVYERLMKRERLRRTDQADLRAILNGIHEGCNTDRQ